MKELKLEIEELEERIAPATLKAAPPGFGHGSAPASVPDGVTDAPAAAASGAPVAGAAVAADTPPAGPGTPVTVTP